MQPPAPSSSSWPFGNQTTSQASGVPQLTVPALPSQQYGPQQVPQKTLSSSAPVQRGDRDCTLRHVSADPYFTAQGPISSDEYHWAVVSHLKSLKPSDQPSAWVTRPVAPIAPSVVESGSSATAAGNVPATSGSAPAAVSAGSPSGETLKHPDPLTSLEELRWRDYQTLRQQQGGTSAAPAIPALPANLPQQPQPAAPQLAAATALAASGTSAPQTPVFPTPVRTLFPPTPQPAAAAAAAAGGGQEDVMDTAECVDAESQFKCMYAQPAAAMASPEEMRVVQVESYKAGRQVVPYWLVSGA
ncbi:hypothetical protein Agub_g10498 [Astrephomene gubernaculifera]|uniref:Uncharacterized protein n=1 Tax=Astrephomene gubernaculifera TaxID=47775 RepID=A0AAD3DWZ7_9CHLO|nr:hypothetical protein Agub_g10498 [Astrephomene gubernaculifera]